MNDEQQVPIAKPAGWDLTQRILRFLFSLLLKMDVQALDRLPDRGPAIIAPNHVSWFDVIFMAAYSKAPPVTFAAEKWDKIPIINLLFRHFGQAIFVNRGAPDKQALVAAMNALKAGRVLGVAPEGTRSHDGVLRKGHDGAAWLASRTDAVIVPVAMWGHEDIIRGHWLRLRRPHVHIRIGEPFRLPPQARKTRSRYLGPYTDMIMHRIAAMLPPERRGIYA